jgi:hypothetical protein
MGYLLKVLTPDGLIETTKCQGTFLIEEVKK